MIKVLYEVMMETFSSSTNCMYMFLSSHNVENENLLLH